MDDNENVIDFQKMNFSFTSQLANISGNPLNQFSNSKLPNNVSQQNGQLVVSGSDGNFHYVRTSTSNESNNQFAQQLPTSSTITQTGTSDSTNISESSLITLPITMPGSKPGDAQQTVHIQVMNPNALQPQTTKFQMGQMSIPTLQSFQPNGTTVLTVAYNPTDGKFISNGFPEGMTVVAALQPQDLQMLAQAQQLQIQHQQQPFIHQPNSDQQELQNQQHLESPILHSIVNEPIEDSKTDLNIDEITVKQEPSDWESPVSQNPPEYSDFMQSQSFNLHSFLKFPGNIKLENDVSTQSEQSSQQPSEQIQQEITSEVVANQSLSNEDDSKDDENDLKGKRRRRAKKKPPKPKQPKPGQVLIATAIDGTTLFCCPECQMAYPEKENLEQHLTEHKIERRYICDICGAGLKRKEHLERHKSGHNPDRPYICSVCLKGFKRKEHLNLHFVIHSGEKNEVCGECGKGFYRKDHLRKHANSHAAKRLKEEMNARAAGLPIPTSSSISNNISESISSNDINKLPNINNNNNNNNVLVNNSLFTRNSDMLNSNNSNGSLNDNNNCVQITNTQAAISLSTVYVPTSDNTTLPVQIQIPQIVTTCSSDGTTSTMIMPASLESQNQALTT